VNVKDLPNSNAVRFLWADQAHPRVQAAAAQHPGGGLPLQEDQGDVPRGAQEGRATCRHARGQGVRHLHAGQADREAGDGRGLGG
jgi:hypothetical protein